MLVRSCGYISSFSDDKYFMLLLNFFLKILCSTHLIAIDVGRDGDEEGVPVRKGEVPLPLLVPPGFVQTTVAHHHPLVKPGIEVEVVVRVHLGILQVDGEPATENVVSAEIGDLKVVTHELFYLESSENKVTDHHVIWKIKVNYFIVFISDFKQTVFPMCQIGRMELSKWNV